MKRRIFSPLLFAALLSLTPIAPHAQQAVSAQIEVKTDAASLRNAELNSKLMRRKMPYQVIVPPNYEAEKTIRFPVLYLLHGLGGHYDNWAGKTNLKKYAADHRIILVMPEGGDGWYTDSANEPNDKYESYIIQELVPEIDKNYRTVPEKRGRAIAGLSMGGFGALKFGVKYPQMFALAASMSGAVAAASYRTSDELPKNEWLRKSIVAVFAAPENPVRRENDLFKLLGEMPPEKTAGLPFLYLDCGTEDQLGFLSHNQQLAQILVTRKIPHEFRQLPGKHDWTFWNNQVREVLRLSDKIFAANNKQ
ncbi:MAG TPA: alpha/beta hydrolase family protein [Pyrinomonadaceae bacterium]|nr:alpha/beta hydrolase family protein [Pyrinomonadaceae bacterium]